MSRSHSWIVTNFVIQAVTVLMSVNLNVIMRWNPSTTKQIMRYSILVHSELHRCSYSGMDEHHSRGIQNVHYDVCFCFYYHCCKENILNLARKPWVQSEAWVITKVLRRLRFLIKWAGKTTLNNKRSLFGHSVCLVKIVDRLMSFPEAKVVLCIACKTAHVDFCCIPRTITCFVFISSQAISFLTPLAVIFVVKIIQRTDRTEIKEACLGMWSQLLEMLHICCCQSKFCLWEECFNNPTSPKGWTTPEVL